MSAPAPSATGSESRLVRVLDDYLAALHRGDAPDRSALLAAHPDLADDLAACLASLDFIRRAASSGSVGSGNGSPPGDDLLPRLLGDFRILREVGRGGMGVVYEAEQLSLGRRVALKVLPFAAALDPRQLARFRVEAQAAAQLHHTNIVPVFSVGTERGVHYYAMQFIDGRSLAEVIHEQREARESSRPADATPSSPSPGLSPSGRPHFQAVARLGVQAAEALEYAHSLGIVHRDVKPANLLLDARGTLWVTDFGLARLHDDAGLTMTGDVLGTLRYMSPEQALARRVLLDQRTDVYSLGVTLYELLTLRPAFDGRDRQELLRQIAFEEPPAPRRLDPSIPRELETIILKAMAREPEGRYATAQELADDLRRFLEHRPIQARRPTLVERGAKWLRRHTTAVAAAALVLLIVVAGLAISNRMISRRNAEITRKSVEVERQRNEIKRALKASEAVRAQAEGVSHFLVDAFSRPDPNRDGRELKVVDLLTSAAARLDTEFAGPPAIKGELLHALGRTMDKLGLPAEAADVLGKARAVRQAALGPDHSDTLATQNSLAEAYLAAGRTAEALDLCEATLKVRESKLGPDHPDTLGSQHNLATAYQKMGDLAHAIPLFKRTLDARKSKLGPDHADTLNTQNNLASAFSDARQHKEALPLFEATLKAREATLGLDRAETLQSRNNLAFALINLGRYREAIPLLEATLEVRESKLGPDHPNTITSLNNLALAYGKVYGPERAVPLFKLALERRIAKLGPDHPEALSAEISLGRLYCATGRPAEGTRLLEDALGRARGRPDARKVEASVPSDLAVAYDAAGRYARAEVICREQLATTRSRFGSQDSRTASWMLGLSMILLKQQKWSEAEPILREALTVVEKIMPKTYAPYSARSLLGGSLLGQGRYAEAEKLVVGGYEGLKAREATIPLPSRPRLTEAADRVVRLYEAWGKPAQAREWKEKLGVADLPADVFAQP